MRLTLFDLDHTLLDGDSDELWCEHLMARGLLPRDEFEPRNRAMVRDYQAGVASAEAFCAFYIGTLAARTPQQWMAERDAYAAAAIAPRIGPAAYALVQRHRDAGDRLVLSTATNRFLAEPSAALLGIDTLIATECEFDALGRFSGRPSGTLNMRDGKVQRLHDWLAAQQMALAALDSTLYSDSINDLPLLCAVEPCGGRRPRRAAGRRSAPARLAVHQAALTRYALTTSTNKKGPIHVSSNADDRRARLCRQRLGRPTGRDDGRGQCQGHGRDAGHGTHR